MDNNQQNNINTDAETTEEEQNKAEKEGKKSLTASVWEFVKFSAIAAIIIVPIRFWIAQPFIVSGASMVPSFQNGDYLIIDEISYEFRNPERGEVIIFRYPEDPSKFFIKRIIGLPGETIEIKNNIIHITNSEFPEGMTLKESYLSQDVNMTDAKMTLDNQEYFVLGDNRNMSLDSRYWGSLPANLITGRAWLRLWPLTNISFF